MFTSGELEQKGSMTNWRRIDAAVGLKQQDHSAYWSFPCDHMERALLRPQPLGPGMGTSIVQTETLTRQGLGPLRSYRSDQNNPLPLVAETCLGYDNVLALSY